MKWFLLSCDLSGTKTLPELWVTHWKRPGRFWWQSQHSKHCFMLWVLSSSADGSYLRLQGHPRWSCKGQRGSMRTGNGSATLFIHYATQVSGKLYRQSKDVAVFRTLLVNALWGTSSLYGWPAHDVETQPILPISRTYWSYLVDMESPHVIGLKYLGRLRSITLVLFQWCVDMSSKSDICCMH